jgi:hypothetical protein
MPRPRARAALLAACVAALAVQSHAGAAKEQRQAQEQAQQQAQQSQKQEQKAVVQQQKQAEHFKPFATSITGLGAPPLGDTSVNTPGVSIMYMNSLANVDPLAVCNDGSPAAYFFAPGSGDGANTWLVYLEGAMFCWDETSCNLRFKSLPFYMSSTATQWATEFAQVRMRYRSTLALCSPRCPFCGSGRHLRH